MAGTCLLLVLRLEWQIVLSWKGKTFIVLLCLSLFVLIHNEHDESRKEQRHWYCTARKQVSLLGYL